MAGTEERTIEVARMRFRFRGDADAARVIERRYGAFLCAPGGPPPISEIAVELREVPADPARTANADVEVRVREDVVTLRGAGMRAEAGIRGDRATIATSGPRPVDVLFRFLLATHLSSRGGLLVHASAVERSSGAWVFSGPSGVGKSTIATHLGGRIVCDEAVALVAEHGRVAVHATPYWRARPHAAPVAGIAFPRRGRAPAWRELSSARAAARLLSQVGPLLERARPEALRTAAAIAGAVPSAEVSLSCIGDIRSWLDPRL